MLTANVSTRLLWDNIRYDPGSCYESSTGIYTAPFAGAYRVSFRLQYRDWSGGGWLIAKVGNDYSSGNITLNYANSMAYGDVLIGLDVGSTIALHAGTNTAGGVSITLVNDLGSYFNITPLFRV